MALILSIRIAQFAVAVARLDDSTLMDVPLVLYAQERQRAVVAAAAAETGLTAGTPLRQAVMRCPGAMYRTATPERDQQAFDMLVRLLAAYSPCIAAHPLTHDAQIDLDLERSTLAQVIADAQRIAEHIRTSLQLVPAVGIATTPFVAQRAALLAGSGTTVAVPAGEEPAFLAPHPVTTLPIDGDITRRLQLLGLHTIGDLAALPLDALQAQFGALGHSLFLLARGQCTAMPIRRSPEPATIRRRARFAGPLSDRRQLDRTVARLAAGLAAQLDQAGWAAHTIVVTLPLEDGPPWIGQHTLSTPTADQALLTQAFLALSRTACLESGVEAITLEVDDPVPTVVTQRDLFAPTAGQVDARDAALARLHTRYAGSFVRAQIDDPAAVLPEQRVRFEPWESL